jgi:hypothetical protein
MTDARASKARDASTYSESLRAPAGSRIGMVGIHWATAKNGIERKDNESVGGALGGRRALNIR